MIHKLRPGQNRIGGQQAGRNLLPVQMDSVQMIGKHPVPQAAQHQFHTGPLWKIKFHGNLDSILMKHTHHIPEFRHRIRGCGVGCFRREITARPVSPGIQTV